MGQGPFYAIPGEINTHQFALHLIDGTALQPSATLAAGDFLEVTNGGTAANADTLPVTETNGAYSWAQSAAESVAGAKVTLLCNDQTAPQTFLDTTLDVLVYSLPEVASKFYTGAHGPGIYVDTAGGDSGTVLGTNGLPTNPCDSWADALTLAGKLGINRFYLQGGSSVTMTASIAGYELYGNGDSDANTVNLGSEICSDATLHNLTITGTQASGDHARFERCVLSSVTALHAHAIECALTGTSTLSSNDDHTFDQCYSAVAGGGTPALTLAANVDVSIRHYSGGMQFNSGGNTNAVSLEGHGQFIIDATCSNFTLYVRGAFAETDNGTNTTIENDASFNRIAASTDANLISVDGVALASHTAGYVPAEIPGGQGYEGSVWFDEDSGVTGTTVGVHGLPGNAVNDFDDAVTLAVSTGFHRIMVVDSACVPTTAVGEVTVVGLGLSTYNFNSEVHTDTTLEGMSVFGALGASSNIRQEAGDLTTVTGLASSLGIRNTLISSSIALRASGWTYFDNCALLAGITFTLDLTENSSNAALTKFSGAVTLLNMDATNTVHIDGQTTVIVDGTCTGGTLIVRGQVTITDNSGGAVTITSVTGVNLTEINGETAPVATLERILGAHIDTTITSGGGSTTSWSATGIPTTNDDQLIDKTGVFIDGDAILRGFVVTDYVDSTKTLTVDKLNVAPSNTDRFIIFA